MLEKRTTGLVPSTRRSSTAWATAETRSSLTALGSRPASMVKSTVQVDSLDSGRRTTELVFRTEFGMTTYSSSG